ncbi:MAG TPA: IS3 family transposase [Synergistaceae bacterium]|nr:IS3 family transposase [Synergistaceae bacterium]
MKLVKESKKFAVQISRDLGASVESLKYWVKQQKPVYWAPWALSEMLLYLQWPKAFTPNFRLNCSGIDSWPTREELKNAIFEYIEVFYNRSRRHSTLRRLSPDEFERRRFDEHEKPEAA